MSPTTSSSNSNKSLSSYPSRTLSMSISSKSTKSKSIPEPPTIVLSAQATIQSLKEQWSEALMNRSSSIQMSDPVGIGAPAVSTASSSLHSPHQPQPQQQQQHQHQQQHQQPAPTPPPPPNPNHHQHHHQSSSSKYYKALYARYGPALQQVQHKLHQIQVLDHMAEIQQQVRDEGGVTYAYLQQTIATKLLKLRRRQILEQRELALRLHALNQENAAAAAAAALLQQQQQKQQKKKTITTTNARQSSNNDNEKQVTAVRVANENQLRLVAKSTAIWMVV